MGGDLGVRGAKPPVLGHGVHGGPRAEPPRFTRDGSPTGVRGLAHGLVG